MRRNATAEVAVALTLLLAAADPLLAAWTQLGDHAISAGMAGPRGASVPFAGMTLDGATLVAVTHNGRFWTSQDQGLSWQSSAPVEAAMLFQPERAESVGPEPGALTIRHPYRAGWLYSLAADLHLSRDGGDTWTALTNEAALPMIGARPSSIAFDPADPERLYVGTEAGLWRSADGGMSWVSLNAALPNFPAGQFRKLDPAAPPLFEAAGVGLTLLPGGAQRWIEAIRLATPSAGAAFAGFAGFVDAGSLELSATRQDAEPPTAFGISGGSRPMRLAGASDGSLWLSADAGASWRPAGGNLPHSSGRRVADLWLAPDSELSAIAVFSGADGARVFRTVDGGTVWDDVTADLPGGEILAVAASADGEAVYVGGEAGVFYASLSLRSPTPASSWQPLGAELPAATAHDLFLSDRTGRLFVALEGYGIYRRLAPDVAESMRLLNAADLTRRAIAPGGLLTLLGGTVNSATIDGRPAPVLLATAEESQIQAPFTARAGSSATIELATSGGAKQFRFPIESLAPAIFTDNGEALVLDAGSGRLLDLTRPARPGARILILASGLGAVDPVWPAGLAAPLENPPAVVALVNAYLDGAPIPVLDATLAGGYVGAYWVEAELPMSLQSGSGSLVIEAGGSRSNAVTLLLAP